MNCVGRATMGEGFAENSGRWLGQIRTVPSQRVVIGSQQMLSSIVLPPTTPIEGRGDGVGLQIGIPIKHWNRLGSQHAIIMEDGIGRGVGLGVNDADGLGLGVKDADISNTRCVGFGVIDALMLALSQIGAVEGQS